MVGDTPTGAAGTMELGMEPTSKQIREAVDKVFTDAGRDRRLVKPYVITAAVRYLAPTPPPGMSEHDYNVAMNALLRKVEAYIDRSNRRGGKIQMMSGRHGGTFLRHEVAGPTRLSQGEVVERIERAYTQLSSLTKDPLPDFKTPNAVSRIRALQVNVRVLLRDLQKDAT